VTWIQTGQCRSLELLRIFSVPCSVVASDTCAYHVVTTLLQAQQYDGLRHSNTRLLNKLQALQGTIQVCCRTRPPSYQELAQGGKVCIDAADDTELMCYDGYAQLCLTRVAIW
jgi:hypothetical protein